MILTIGFIEIDENRKKKRDLQRENNCLLLLHALNSQKK